MSCAQEVEVGERFAKVGRIQTGKALAGLCVGLYADDECEKAFALIVEAVEAEFNLRGVILDGTLTKESEGFWQLNRLWSLQGDKLPAGSYKTIVDCSARLNAIGEPDLAAGLPLDALVKYCRRHTDELGEALAYAMCKPETVKCVVGVLIVGFELDQTEWFAKVVVLLKTASDAVRVALYNGLQMTKWGILSESEQNTFLELIRNGLKSNIDEVKYATSGALVAQAVRNEDERLRLILNGVLNGDSMIEKVGVVEQCPGLSSGVDGILKWAWWIVETLAKGNVESRLARGIDTMLTALWGKDPERALRCCEDAVMRNESISSGSFPNTMCRLGSLSGKIVDEAVTRWFLSNEPRVFRFAHALLKDRDPNADFRIEVDADAIREPAVPWFLARKGVGWFYYHKKTCVRFVLSCMANMGEEEVDDFLPTFYNPLCLHYVNLVDECLRDRKADSKKPYYKKALDAVKQAKALYAKAQKLLPIPDLEPTTRRRGEFARYQNRLMSKAFKQAQERSILKFLAGEPTILLHGKEWVSWRKDPSGALQRNATKLSRNGFKLEVPSLQRLDSLNLEYLLLRMRLERVVYESAS